MRITSVTLNAAVDKTYYLPQVVKGTVMRAHEVITAAGGKGINVARVLRQLGHEDVAATGFVGGYNGSFIEQQVREQGVEPAFVHVDGESRLCLNIIDRTDNSSTEVLEPGPAIPESALAQMKQELVRLAAGSRLVTMSGSLPAGVPPGFYAELARIARDAGAEVLLDSSGEALSLGLAGGPAFIKPNEDEIGPLLQHVGKQAGELAEGIQALMAQGIPYVAVTLGADGALVGVRGELFRVSIPAIQVVNTVGSGDSFVAGFAYGYARGWESRHCLIHAAAAGCANALNPMTGHVKLVDHERIAKEVKVEQWDS